MRQERDTPPLPPVSTSSNIRLLLGAVFLVFLAQMTLNPIIAPLSREVGLAEWQIGLTISTAALMVVGTSQFWGRRSQSIGRKPVLLMAFGIATTTMTLFAVVSQLGMLGLMGGSLLFVLFLLLRGLGFGSAMAAVPPTAQAYIANVTTDESQRVKGMSAIGAAQGVAVVSGAVLGGTLATFGLLTPLIVIPLLLAAALVTLMVRLRREEGTELIERPARVRPFDRRVWPFLLAGFGMFTSVGLTQIITGFLIQDRLDLNAEQTGFLTGAALFAIGGGMIISQTVIVPRSGWSPSVLLRVGSPLGIAGFCLLIPDLGLVALLAALLVIGVGLGIAMPGYTAGPTLLMRRDEQGGVAGLITANNGLTFVVAPTLATSLYSVWPELPVILGAVVMTTVTLFVYLHPVLRKATP